MFNQSQTLLLCSCMHVDSCIQLVVRQCTSYYYYVMVESDMLSAR
jgi:hypothetical protein